MNTKDQIIGGAQDAWAFTLAFVPKLLLFIIILVAGYFIAKWIGKLVNNVLERVGFDKLVERGGIKTALERSKYDASDIMCKIVFYMLFLFVLQLAFGVFGPNPISDILTRVIAFLPILFVALLIIVIAAAVAKGVKEIIQVALGGVSYGKTLANFASIGVIVIGIFAALSHLQIAPAIVNGLFYAMLVVVAGSAIIAIGGGGIAPMKERWEKALGKFEEELPKLKEETKGAGERVTARAKEVKEEAKSQVQSAEGGNGEDHANRGSKRYEPKERSRRES